MMERFLAQSAAITVAYLAILDAEGKQPLHWAAVYGNNNVVEYLVSQGMNVSEGGSSLTAPLHYAAQSNSKEMTELLIEHGARVADANAEGQQPLHYAGLRPFRSAVAPYLLSRALIPLPETRHSIPLFTMQQEKVHSTR
jgi:ankyrin repeat protein